MKRLIIFCLIIPIILKTYSQNIYFISGHPFRNISTQFPAYVFKYEGDSLVSKLQISNEDLLLIFIKVYPELNIVTALTKEYKTKSKQETLNIIHTNKPDTVYRIRVELPEDMRCSHSNLVGLSKTNIFECYDCFDPLNQQKPIKERIKKVFGWNVYDFTRQELTPDDYKNTIIIGSPAAAIEGWDYINLYSTPNNGLLVIPVNPDTTKRPVYPLVLPDSLQIKEKKLLAVLINNDSVSVIVVDESTSSKSELGTSTLYIYNKSQQEWFTFKIKGNNDSMRGFGKWIAGTVVSNNVNLIFNEKGQLKDKIKFSRISPGKEKRRQAGTKYGTFFDMRADFYDYYYPGILYLLNVNTQQYLEWETGQGDSEILLVQDEVVYYRINDEIYKAQILNGEKLGKPELLIKDERVPDIHWAFISKN